MPDPELPACPGNDVYLIEKILSYPQSPVSLIIWLSFNAH